MKKLFCLLYTLCIYLPATTAQPLNVRIDRLLADTLLTDSEVGLMVYDLDDDTLLYSYQAEKLYRPASTLKLATAITALKTLGQEHLFATTLYSTGTTFSDSTLHGNLYAVGGFDPLFSSTDMEAFANAVEQSGIRRINGSIVANISLKDTLRWGSGWCWDDEMPTLTPLLCEQTDSFPQMLRQALAKRGIGITDSITRYSATPPDTVMTLLAQSAHTLTDIMERMMKKSDNLHAEALFYHLAAYQCKHPYAPAEEGAKAIRQQIGQLGFKKKSYRIADGSGVSLYNYLSPEILIALLRYAYQHPYIYRPLYRSLPIAGVDGTLQHRMKNTAAYRNVRAKTGTLTGISSLAGYARTPNGHTLAFAIINQNILRARGIRQWQDRFCHELCR